MDWSKLRLFILLFVGFVAATVIGTLLHECGHYAAAKWIGYDAAIHYNNTSLNRPAGYVGNFNGTERQLKRETLYICAGGPVQTMLTGSVAMFALVWARRKLRVRDEWSLMHWTLVFVALFWLRQPANLFMAGIQYLSAGNTASVNDEIVLAGLFGLPRLVILITTGLAGLVVLTWIVFFLLPKRTIPVFLLAGLCGGITGYYFWLVEFGPMVLP